MTREEVNKLIAEIERRKIEHRKSLKKDITLISEAMLKGSLGAYESIEHFITSLQREQPEVELEKEMKESEQGWYNEAAKYWAEHCELNKTKDQRILILDAPTFTSLVSDFYELGLNARKEE